jgi:hypothetical protein
MSALDVIQSQFRLLGTPSDAVMDKIASARFKKYVKTLPLYKRVLFKTAFPNVQPQGLDN